VTRKSIQTNGPIVSCDVCGRTLLRGERHDVFLHGGSRRTVCELCTARAAHEGWIREGLDGATVRAHGERRRGSFLQRLRSRRVDGVPRPEHEPPGPGTEFAGAPLGADFDVDHDGWVQPPAPPAPEPAPERERFAYEPREQRSVHAVPTNADLKMARALELFNASSHRRTVTGVARSLGSPLVAVRPSPTEGSVVTIAVAWELSWYRYEVDLADEASGVRVADQGAELHELDPADQQPNAAADDSGALHLVAQHA
jgi:hypothetical protein